MHTPRSVGIAACSLFVYSCFSCGSKLSYVPMIQYLHLVVESEYSNNKLLFRQSIILSITKKGNYTPPTSHSRHHCCMASKAIHRCAIVYTRSVCEYFKKRFFLLNFSIARVHPHIQFESSLTHPHKSITN